MAFEAGQRVGDYEIVGRLGAGGLGVVYEVQHLISQRREAMKLLLPDQSDTPEQVERFRREVQTLATLNHPNIAALHTAFYYDGQLAMVLELVHGETLRDMQLRAPIPIEHVLRYTAHVLEALVYAHGLGIVHRDIKPSNIMITSTGVVKLLDFGIARTEQASDLTRAGFLVGSLNYMSPEQVKGEKATAKSDIYSVGVTLYELLTGRLPIVGSSNYEIMLGHMQRMPVAPHEIATVPRSLSAAVMRALEKDADARFASAQEFLQALGRAAAGGTTAETMPLVLPAAVTAPEPTAPSGSTKVMAISAEPRVPSSGSIQGAPLEDITRKLAVYIGPVAKFVIKKLAAQHEDIDTIYREAARQISSDTDRAAFLRAKAK